MCRRLTSNEDVGGSARVQVVLVDAVVALHSESSYFSCAPNLACPRYIAGCGESFGVAACAWRKLWVCRRVCSYDTPSLLESVACPVRMLEGLAACQGLRRAGADLVGMGVPGEDHVDAVLVQDGLHLLLEALHLLEV